MKTDHMTDEWVDGGQYSAQDVINLRNELVKSRAHEKELDERWGALYAKSDKETSKWFMRTMSLRGTLESALEYFTDRADADHNGHAFVGNKEAQMAAEIQEALNKTVASTERQDTITPNPPLPVT
jgi:hypothetical protein